MVSTRQMSTSLSTANSGANEESMRLSVVTRQTSSNLVMTSNAATVPSVPTPASSSSASSVPSSLRSSIANQLNLTQVVKSSSSSVQQQQQQRQVHLLDLPTEILGKIFSYVGYKKVGNMRVISHKFNDVCMHVLNSTFSKLTIQMFNRFQSIKSNMPRRESARRNHYLATECDIIETCYMRLSLLQMTFGKRIERGHCCFFPGAILDEVYTVLNYIRNTPRLERPYRVTDELFDLSTMAMEYFRDQIEPKLPDIAYYNKDFFNLSAAKRPALIIASDLSDSSSNIPSPPQSNMVLRKGIRKIKQGMKMYNNQLSVLRNELRTCKRKASEQGKQIGEQQKLLAEQQKQVLEYANRLDENDKKNEEMSRKFSTLLQELNKCKTELQYWRSKSPAIPTCTSCGQKVVSTLPLDDYNALINQGVKPEDIILNVDDTDESDASINSDSLSLSREFVFPDELTTARLLAVNSVSKNLKRPHSAGSSCSSSASGADGPIGFNDIQSQSTSTSSNKITEMKNSIYHTIGNSTPGVSSCSAATQAPTITTSSSVSSNTISHTDLSLGLRSVIKNSITATALDGGNKVIGEVVGYPPNIFYGSSSTESTNSTALAAAAATTAAINTEKNSHSPKGIPYPSTTLPLSLASSNQSNFSSLNNPDSSGGEVPGVVSGCATATEDVTSLNLLTNNETKKARRVQKASRFSNGNGKRK